METSNDSVSNRFVNEDIGIHWQVDSSENSSQDYLSTSK